jgi:hypothetical protein
LANPIVNFNIEPLSSLLLARPAGPVRIMFQQPKGKPAYTWREPGGRFQRLVYHPHGLATLDTVMTATQAQLIGGKEPREIEAALRARVNDDGVSLPIVHKTFALGTSSIGAF